MYLTCLLISGNIEKNNFKGTTLQPSAMGEICLRIIFFIFVKIVSKNIVHQKICYITGCLKASPHLYSVPIFHVNPGCPDHSYRLPRFLVRYFVLPLCIGRSVIYGKL